MGFPILIPLTPTLSRQGRGIFRLKKVNIIYMEKRTAEMRSWAVLAGAQTFTEAVKKFRFWGFHQGMVWV
jgi:hypothetical protein